MPHPLLPSSSTALKQRLLSGASAAVIVLALSVAAPSGVMAQEIIGNDANSANLLAPGGGVDIISGTVGGQFGAIDVDGNVTYNSITLTESETISVFDGNGAGNVASITNDFVIASSAFGALVFARDEMGNVAEHANMEIFGNLEGLNNSRGGDLAISAFDQSNNNASQFHVRGSTYMGALSVTAGDAVAADAGDMSAAFGFGSNNDTFNAFGLTVTGGNGVAANEGGQASSSVSVDGTNNNTAIFGAGGITITGGQGGVDGNGGLSRLTVVGNATIDGAVTVIGGDQGTGSGNGGAASLDFDDETGTISLANILTIATGTDTSAVIGTAGNAQATFASITVNANDGVVLSEQHNATATLTLDGTSIIGGQTFNGAIMAANDGDGIIRVQNSSSGVTFSDVIGSSLARIGTITLTDGDDVNFNGDVFAGAITVADAINEANFDGDVDATDIDGGAGLLDFNGNLTIGTGNLTVGTGNAELAGNVSGTGEVIVGTGNDATFDGAAGQMVDVAVTSPGGGDIFLSNTSDAGVTFNSTIGATGGAEVGTIDLATNVNATFNDTVFGTGLTLVDGATLTVNDEGATATPMVTLSANNALSLATSTINLGSEVGDQDIVFQLTDGGDDVVFAAGDDQTTINLAANFLDGDLTLIDDDTDLTTVADQITVTQTALTTFTEDTTTVAGDIIINATARSASDTADELGVSEEDAVAMRRAVESTDAAGDDEGLDELTEALNSGNPAAAQAARQVGTQEDALGGASEASFQTFGEMFDAITDRLQGSQSGFSGGDLDGPYSLQASSRTRGVWGQAFGGVTTADGDSDFAGYDAAYGGVMAGIDGNITEDLTIGAFGSYTFSTVDGDGAGDAQMDANTFGFGVYAGYASESFYLDGFAAYALSQNDLTRQDILNRTITADYDASQFSVGLAGGVPIEVSTHVFITPNASLTYNRYEADSYTETGSPLAQTVDPDAVSNLTGTIGARIHAVYENFGSDGTVFIPELRVALIGDLIDDDATASATFSGTTAYQVTGTDTDDIGALIGVGLGLDNPDWAAGISYDADLRGDFMSHTGRAEFRWKF